MDGPKSPEQVKPSLASGFATAELHRHAGHDLRTL